MYPSTQSREGRCCVDIFPILYGFTFWKDQKATGLTPLEKWIYLYHVASSYGVNVRAWNIHQHQHHTTVHFNCVDLTITFSYSFFFYVLILLFIPLSLCVHCIILLFVFEIQYACQWMRFIFPNLYMDVYIRGWVDFGCVCVCVAPVCEYEWVNVCPLFCSFFFRARPTKTCHAIHCEENQFHSLDFHKKWSESFSSRPRFRA